MVNQYVYIGFIKRIDERDVQASTKGDRIDNIRCAKKIYVFFKKYLLSIKYRDILLLVRKTETKKLDKKTF